MAGTGSSHDPWTEGDRPRRDTTLTDIDLVSCLTRLQVLAALGTAPMNVSRLAEAVEISVTLASGHLSRMARSGLVVFDRQGGHHVYHLAPGVSLDISAAGVRVSAKADDGCEAQVFVPASSAIMRILRPAVVAARTHVASVTVQAAPAPAPSRRAPSPRRRPSGPG